MKDAFLAALGGFLAPWAFARLRHRDEAPVFLFHRVCPNPDPLYPPMHPADFREFCEIIPSRLTCVPLRELLRRRDEGRPLNGLFAITFDDGYRDFLDYAYPVLLQRGLPATHFLVTDCLHSGLPPWNWRLRRLRASADHVAASFHDRASYARLARPARAAALDAEEARSRDLPPSPPMLRPGDLCRIDNRLIEWGSHTASHSDLGLCPEGEIVAELVNSKAALSEMTGRQVDLLAFPQGSHRDVARIAAREAGFRAAFAVGQRMLDRACDPFAIPRYDTYSRSAAFVSLEISGISRALRKAFQ